MNPYTPCVPGFVPVIMLFHEDALFGGRLDRIFVRDPCLSNSFMWGMVSLSASSLSSFTGTPSRPIIAASGFMYSLSRHIPTVSIYYKGVVNKECCVVSEETIRIYNVYNSVQATYTY